MSTSARNVLQLFGRYHYLTSKQVAHAMGWDNFHQYAQKQLTLLTRPPDYDPTNPDQPYRNYLAMENHLEQPKLKGAPERVWTLTQKGRQALADMDVIVRPRIKQDPERQQLFMRHTHAITDVLISCDLGAEALGVEMVELWHDQDLKRQPAKVTLPDGTKGTITPDGLTVFGIDQQSYPFAWEVDMGTEDRLGQWLPKIRRLMAYNQGVFQKQFSYDGFRVVMYVRSKRQPSATRLQNLLKWTEDELTAQKRRGWGPFFLFTCIDPVETDPADWLSVPHFLSPFDPTPHPLLEVAR